MPDETKQLDREVTLIKRISKVGLKMNLLLAAAKLSTGYLAGSLALVADGFNSLTDIATDFAVIIGTGLGSRPADRHHPYGHGKLETLVAGLVALGVFAVGVGITFTAVKNFIDPAELPWGLPVIVVASITIVIKEWLFFKTKKVAIECRSAALKAKAWDHRSDSLVSLVVLAGGVGAMLGWQWGDAFAGCAVGLVITTVGGRLLFEVILELSEATAGEDITDQIQAILGNFDEVRGWHQLRIRRLGRELVMDVHILLDPDYSVMQGHDIVQQIEQEVEERINWPVNFLIHVDPNSEAIRKARIAAGDRTLK